jgi:hypothetical protein
MMGKLLRFLSLFLLAPLIYAFMYEAFLFIASVFSFDGMMWFLIGLVVFFLVYLVALKGRIDFLEHLAHELEHAAVALIFTGKLPSRMVIEPEKKSEVEAPQGGGCLRTLAPYYLPLLTIPFLILKALTTLAFQLLKIPLPAFLGGILDLLIGATLGFHYASLFREFRPNQTDLKKMGGLFSVVTVFVLNVLFLVLIAAVVTEAYEGLVEYVKGSLARTVDGYKWAFEFLQTQVPPVLRKLYLWLRELLCPDCAPVPPS